MGKSKNLFAPGGPLYRRVSVPRTGARRGAHAHAAGARDTRRPIRGGAKMAGGSDRSAMWRDRSRRRHSHRAARLAARQALRDLAQWAWDGDALPEAACSRFERVASRSNIVWFADVADNPDGFVTPALPHEAEFDRLLLQAETDPAADGERQAV